MTHVKHLIQYLALVGAPALGLLGVLRLGRDLTAPMAVHGTYPLAATGGSAGPCLRQLVSDSTLAIAQSGERIEVRLARGAVLHGVLDGTRITARGTLPAGGECPADEPVRFEAATIRAGREVRLEAQLRAECAACGSLALRAVQTAPAP
jgi:hypothetical protein